MRNFLKNQIIPFTLSFIGTLIALFPSNPNNITLPSRDSGVFLYVGWRLLNGSIPYRDVWDHKPPLIYFIDALGLILSPQSLLGVWLLQFLFIFFTIYFLYKSLDESLGVIPAIVGTVILTSGLLTILEQGNVTEEYALPFQTLSFWLIVRTFKSNFSLRQVFWIGICGGFAFYFKQTTIGIWITFVILLIWTRVSQKKSPFADLMSLLAGGGLISIVLVLFFASQHALNDYWYQAFIYNFIYIGKHEGIRRLIPVFIKGFLFLSQGAVLYLAILGWLSGFFYIMKNRKLFKINIHPIILLALIDFPIEIVLITISGRSILHYYLTPLPVMALLSGILVHAISAFTSNIKVFSARQTKNGIPEIALFVVLILQINQVKDYPTYVNDEAGNSYAPVIKYVENHTNQDDKVLVLGAESVVNFLSRRVSPTRYVYQYPLQLLGSRGMFEEYFQQIIENRPALIIDAPGSNQLNENLYKPLQTRSAKVRDGVQYLIENYQPVMTYGDWVIYKLTTNP